MMLVKDLMRFLGILGISAITAYAPSALSAAYQTPEATPLDLVVVVDESGSLADGDVLREIEATATITQSGLNPRSRVTVVGFGSNNGLSGQEAAREVCRPTVTSGPASLQYLAECVGKLKRRQASEGNDTDHAAALTKAMSYFATDSPQGALKAVFLLTDGRLDVHNSPNYGSGDRNAAAQDAVSDQLGAAAETKVQIWSLGFGQADKASLDAFSAGGSQETCDSRPESRPRARIVSSSSDVIRSLHELFAAATCSGLSRTDTQQLSGGESRELAVTIPAIATDGTITVTKGDPRVKVDFVDPQGVTVRKGGNYDGSLFERSGENGRTEALRIRDPRPGPWKVRLSAPSGLREQIVSATALWQGAVRSYIVVEPPSARLGQRLTIRLSLVTRKGEVVGGEALRGLNFFVTATGDGLSTPAEIQMRDDGAAPDRTAEDGTYAGVFSAPAAEGTLTVTGTVKGAGVRADQVPVTVKISDSGTLVQSRVEFDAPDEVWPGVEVPGTILADNGTGQPRRVRLAVEGTPGSRVTVSPSGPLELASGESERDFHVVFGDGSARGGTAVTVRVVDDADPRTVYGNGQLSVRLRDEPGFAERYRWVLLGLLLLVVLAAAGWYGWRQAHRRRIDVRHLTAELRRNGERVGAPLKAPSKWAEEFRFVIRDLEGAYPRLDHPSKPGDRSPYRASRDVNGSVAIRTPDGQRDIITLSGQGLRLTDGLSLSFRDSRPAASRPRPGSAQRDDRTAQGGYQGGGQSGARPRQEEKDPWM